MCIHCANAIHFMCGYPNEAGKCCCSPTAKLVQSESAPKESRPVGRPQSNPEDMANPLQTGRMRALRDKKDIKVCEWAFLKFAGGGPEPIVGCKGNLARHVHHGPNKSTLDNSEGNAHKVCTSCHNRWHARNNAYYVGDRPDSGGDWYPLAEFKPHDPTTIATEEEYEESELEWKLGVRNVKSEP